MISLQEARELIENEVASYPQPEGDRYIILEESLIEKSWGWVFFYTSEKWHRTKELKYAVAGNAPFIVEKTTGDIIITGTAEPVQSYINRYESTGGPNA